MRQVFALRTHEEIKEVLLDETAGGPDIHYYMIRGGREKVMSQSWKAVWLAGNI